MTEGKKKKRDERIVTMRKVCGELGITIFEMNTHSYRLRKKGYPVIDYYPTKNRAFYHRDQEWIDVEDVAAFINYEFTAKAY